MTKIPDKTISDADLLAHVFRDVQPLTGRKITNSPPIKFGTRKLSSSASPVLKTQGESSHDTKLPNIQHGDAPGLDKRTAQRLRRGRINVEAQLDLHGLKQDEAHIALCQFLTKSYNIGHRCVLVITGKGALSQGGGVLRKMVPLWLNENTNRNFVLSFTYSTPADGGTGAIYILLKRKRR